MIKETNFPKGYVEKINYYYVNFIDFCIRTVIVENLYEREDDNMNMRKL